MMIRKRMKFLRIFVTIVSLFSWLGISYGYNRTIEGDGYHVLVRNPSGEITLKTGENMDEVMAIWPISIKEYNENDTEITEHGYDDFAETEFDITEPVDEVQYGVNAFIMTYEVNLIYGQLTVEMTVFQESGTVHTTSGEIFDITKGTVLFSISIIDWDFCGVQDICEKEQNGEYLDVTFGIKGNNYMSKTPELATVQRGKKGTSISSRDPATYHLGSSEVILSNLILVDNKFSEMGDKYPSVKMKENPTFMTVTCRLSKFNDTISYEAFGLPVWKHTASGLKIKVNAYWLASLMLLFHIITK